LANDEKKHEQSLLLAGGSKWTGKYPILRMIHVIDHDEIKRAFHTRFDLPYGRMFVENRNTREVRASSVWQLIADKWNDPMYLPTTGVMPLVHPDFCFPIALDYGMVSHMQPASAEKVKEKWQAINLQLKRVIASWERSGQGEGGHVPGEDKDEENTEFEFGALINRPQGALDQRKNFIDGKSSYLLYLWEVLAQHDLLSSSVQRLNEDTRAGNGHLGVPSVIGRRRFAGDEDDSIGSLRGELSSKKTKQNVDVTSLSENLRDHSDAMVVVAKMNARQREMDRLQSVENSIESQINSLRDTKRNLILRLELDEVSKNKVLGDVIMKEVASIDEEITQNQGRIERMHAEMTTTPLNQTQVLSNRESITNSLMGA
jgi:hypothetical protein